jgi:hypothetical protein
MRWAMTPRSLLALALSAATATATGCSSSSNPVAPVDSGTPPADAAGDAPAPPADAAMPVDSGATTTIAAARAGNVTTPITVVAVVTALHGVPGDYSQWYIEDPAGGPSSGVNVYCDPVLAACPTIRAPAVNTLVLVTGSLSTYKGTLQLVPTAQTVLQATTTPPPVATVTAADLAAGATSQYRGVVVQIAAKLTVDDLTPAALYDTQCNVAPPADAGVDGAVDAAAPADGGMPLCTGCAPPTYAGFQAHDSMSREVYVEQFFFNTDHLQSSPECVSQPGMVAVTQGMTFSSITGVLDWDGYGSVQALYPLGDSSYVTP